MDDLIEALQIMRTKGNVLHPTHCSHDELYVYPRSMDFTADQLSRLDELGFFPNDEGGFSSFKYGSC